MSYDRSYQRTTTSRNRRPLYAPPPPARGSHAQHSLLGYWVPLVVTGTIAIGGLAAWIWSERSAHDEDDYPHEKPPRPPTGPTGPYPPPGSQGYSGPPPPNQRPPYQGPPPSQSAGPQGGPPPVGGEAASYYSETNTTTESRNVQQADSSSWYGRAAGMMRRTPSPQQFFDQASKQVTASVAAAGAALGSIIEGEEDDGNNRPDEMRDERRSKRSKAGRSQEREGFSDHERWSEEADEKKRVDTVDSQSEKRADAARSAREEKGKGRPKRAVAVVVNADTGLDISSGEDAGFRTEHASILSHLPSRHDSDNNDVFVLIYAPKLKSLPPVDYQPAGTKAPSTAGSYSQISTPAATPGSELQSISPRVDAADSPSKQFDALYQQALTIVSSPTQILPFTTTDGYVHILRHLAPQLVYISDTLSGNEGDDIAQLKGWVGHTILVAGDDGHGGLADTETEDEGNGKDKQRWYDHSSLVGLGKDVEVVDAARVGDDWVRRIGGRD